MERERVVTNCTRCGAAISEGRAISFPDKGGQAARVTVCPTCASTSLVARGVKAETEDPNLLGALAFGLGAAVLSALLWYGIVVLTNYQLGIVAIAVGWLVAQAVMRGAGGKRGPRLQALSVACTLVAMALSEYLIVHHFTAQSMAQRGYGSIPLLLPVETMVLFVVEGLKGDPLTLLFWGIAVWQAFTLPAARRAPQAGA